MTAVMNIQIKIIMQSSTTPSTVGRQRLFKLTPELLTNILPAFLGTGLIIYKQIKNLQI
jgi:hypothetical protein